MQKSETHQLDKDAIETLLQSALAQSSLGPTGRVTDLRRLSGGANMETWSFDWVRGVARHELILRRSPVGMPDPDSAMPQITLSCEARLLTLVASEGVPVPSVLHLLPEDSPLAPGYVMSRERGEALPNRILNDDRFATARQKLARQCGETLARIHSIDAQRLPPDISRHTLTQRLAQKQQLMDRFGNCSPVHQLALNWLIEHAPATEASCLVHGDFRNGNLLVDEEGLVAVLDWEIAHLGYPTEDIGHICGNVWRFGHSDKPVGGFGEYDELLDGYRAIAGWAPTREDIHYWEVFCALSWGLACLYMVDMYRTGTDPSLERAAIGRRTSESEIDLLLLLDGRL